MSSDYHRTHYRTPQHAHLAPHHRRMLLDESGISPEIVNERGYHTVGMAEVPEAFKRYQRRAGLLIPVRSPSGQTGHRLRPDQPRKGKDGKLRKYEQPADTPNMIDVHPKNTAAIGDTRVDLWITEGEKKGDALASHGLCAVTLFGVWGWCKPDTRGEELLPCWDHVAITGRRVYVLFDADIMHNANVQLALGRLVDALQARGAEVLVVYLPGPEKGVDDFLAAGGSVEDLEGFARPFEPQDIPRIRLSKDAQLRAAVGELQGRFFRTDWSNVVGTGERPHWMRGHSCRDAVKVAIDHAATSGRIDKDGVAFTLATRQWALEAAMSRRTLIKVVAHLEAEGWLRRNYEGRAADEAGSYVLLTPRATLHHKGGKGGGEGSVVEGGYDPGGEDLRAPRLRWSSPGGKVRRGVVKDTRRVRYTPRRRVDPHGRLGKVRGAAVDILRRAGGKLELEDLYGRLHPGRSPQDRRRWRPWDLRRRHLSMLEEARIVTVTGGVVALADDWMDRLEEARELGGEIEQERRDRERYRRQREGFRARNQTEADPAPTEAEMDARREERERRRKGNREPIVSDLAAAVRDYLEANPKDAVQLPGWIGATLWAYELYQGKPSPPQVVAALEELGGDRYRLGLIRRSEAAA